MLITPALNARQPSAHILEGEFTGLDGFRQIELKFVFVCSDTDVLAAQKIFDEPIALIPDDPCGETLEVLYLGRGWFGFCRFGGHWSPASISLSG
jgi:hypothetical protein